MPSSLVFAALVVAWLAVLVPVAARRRQSVPRPAESHLSARVLARPERTVTATAETDAGRDDEESERDREQLHRPDAGTPRGRVLDRGRGRRPFRDDTWEDEGMDVRDDEGRTARVDDRDEVGYDDRDETGYDDRDETGYDDRDETGYDDRDESGYDEAVGRYDVPDRHPRAYRPGRGGFDADGAAAAAHARYAFRQRIALGLIAVAVLSLFAALLVSSTLWWLHLAADLGLAGYLVFRRRQTRIEEEVRRRRLARLTGERRALEARRQRQVAHEEYLAEGERWDVEDDADDGHDRYEVRDDGDDDEALDEALDDDEDDDGLDVPAPRRIAPRAPVPEVPDGMELVADTEEDPAFHDLEDSRVPAYRRMAAGA